MNTPLPDDLSGVSMLELFRAEADTQLAALTAGLLDLERGARSADCLETLMRAAHSLKGAARIVNLLPVERVSHALEDCFEAARRGTLLLRQTEIDLLLRGVDTLVHLIKHPEAAARGSDHNPAQALRELIHTLHHLATDSKAHSRSTVPARPAPQPPEVAGAAPSAVTDVASGGHSAFSLRRLDASERVLRLTAENLNRLLGLAGESLVESRWLRPFADSLQQLKRRHLNLAQQLDSLRQQVENGRTAESTAIAFHRLHQELAGAQQFLTDRVQELDIYDRRAAHLSQRLYLEVLRTRMRPFGEGVRRFPRMVRDLARALEKEVKLEIYGETTQVDRDILERLETPLAHLLRNAVDHGCETKAARLAGGKPAEGTLRLEARHSAGVLLVTVTDDGAGVNLEQLRRAIVKRRLTTAAHAEMLSEAELLEFLFLPGFTLKAEVTEISGRGFGLDIVQHMVRSVRGACRIQNLPRRGLRVQLQLPLTLSVLRALLVDVAGEPYAIPLSQIHRTLKLPPTGLSALEGRQYFHFADQQIELAAARRVLDCDDPTVGGGDLAVVVLGDRHKRFGLVVDRFLGERELVVQPLEPRLGKIQHVSAAALMEDGAPALILDVDDLMHTMEEILAAGRILIREPPQPPQGPARPKRVLIVDDSRSVRELERRLVAGHGYSAEVADDGVEAWEALRQDKYDLVITDIEMPRLDGVELARRIKADPDLKHLPVLIVSYKDRDEDRLRGLEAGADYYLTKGSFHDQSLLHAVVDLIGEPDR